MGVDVTGDDWHTGGMNTDERREIGARVLIARRAAGMDKEPAAREARVSSITWTRVEEGEAVRDTSLAKVLRVVGLSIQPEATVPVTVGELSDDDLLAELTYRLKRYAPVGGKVVIPKTPQRQEASLKRQRAPRQ